jgi:hypothetical protein
MGSELTPKTIFMNDHILFWESVTGNNLAGAYIDEPLVGNLINQLITHIILDPKKEILKKNCSSKKFECPLPRSTLRAPATIFWVSENDEILRFLFIRGLLDWTGWPLLQILGMLGSVSNLRPKPEARDGSIQQGVQLPGTSNQYWTSSYIPDMFDL